MGHSSPGQRSKLAVGVVSGHLGKAGLLLVLELAPIQASLEDIKIERVEGSREGGQGGCWGSLGGADSQALRSPLGPRQSQNLRAQRPLAHGHRCPPYARAVGDLPAYVLGGGLEGLRWPQVAGLRGCATSLALQI